MWNSSSSSLGAAGCNVPGLEGLTSKGAQGVRTTLSAPLGGRLYIQINKVKASFCRLEGTKYLVEQLLPLIMRPGTVSILSRYFKHYQ